MALAETLNNPMSDPIGALGGVMREKDIQKRGAKSRELIEPTMRAESEARTALDKETARARKAQIDEEKRLQEGFVTNLGTAQTAYESQLGQQPERTITAFNPERATELAVLTAIMGAFAGGISGRAGLSAMKGVSEGYRSGQEDLYKREVDNYEAALGQYKQTISEAKQIYDNAVKLETEQRGAGLIELKKLDPLLQDSVITAKVRAQDLKGVGDSLREAMKLADQMEQKKVEAGMRPSPAPRFGKLVVQGTDSEGNPRSLIFNPFDPNFNAAAMENPNPSSGGFVGFGPEKGQQFGQREVAFAGRVQQALSSAGQEIDNLLDSPAVSGMPVFAGLIGRSPEGVIGSLVALGARKATNEENRAFQVLTGQISAALGRIEAQGLANGTTLANLKAFDELKPLAGDHPLIMALYLARLKQELEVGLSVYTTNRAVTPEQKAAVKQFVDPVLKKINFTPAQVLNQMSKSGRDRTVLEQSQRLSNAPIGSFTDSIDQLTTKLTIQTDPAAIAIRNQLRSGAIDEATAVAQLRSLGY